MSQLRSLSLSSHAFSAALSCLLLCRLVAGGRSGSEGGPAAAAQPRGGAWRPGPGGAWAGPDALRCCIAARMSLTSDWFSVSCAWDPPGRTLCWVRPLVLPRSWWWAWRTLRSTRTQPPWPPRWLQWSSSCRCVRTLHGLEGASSLLPCQCGELPQEGVGPQQRSERPLMRRGVRVVH